MNSQSVILQKLQSLNVGDEVKIFITDIMNFYKKHISKLQQIIVQKQQQIDQIYQMKQNSSENDEYYKQELNDLSLKNKELFEGQLQISKEKDNLLDIIENLNGDLSNYMFEIKVKEDDLKNSQNQNQLLQRQNDMLMEENFRLKSLMQEQVQRPSNNEVSLIQEIKELKLQLKNQNQFNQTQQYQKNFSPNQYQTEKRIPSLPKNDDRRHLYDDKKINFEERRPTYEDNRPIRTNRLRNSMEQRNQELLNQSNANKEIKNQFKTSDNNPFQKTQEMPKQETGEYQEMSVPEMQEFLTFLQEKEVELQRNLWKLPAKPRNKLDKESKKDIEKQLDEVTKEIHSISLAIKNYKQFTLKKIYFKSKLILYYG